MDKTLEKTCLEDISVLVFDSLQKVTLKTVSNNWDLENNVAKDILNKWLDQNKAKLKELIKEYIVQGINSKGIFKISVVSEDNKNSLEKKWKNFNSWLYSIETKSNSRSLDLPPVSVPIQVKTIRIESKSRDLFVPVKVEPTTSHVDTTKIKTPFGMVKPVDKKIEVKKEVKTEKKQEVVKKTPIKEEKVEEVKVIDPAKAGERKKVSPEVKPGKTTGKKNVKVAQGKSSISSFFGKPSNSKASTEGNSLAKTVTAEKQKSPETAAAVKIKEKPKVEQKKEDVTRKRSASPEKSKTVPQKKKPAAKKLKLKNPTNKRSRIQVLEDSSEEEADEPEPIEEPESKLIKFDREMTPEEMPDSPVKKSSPEKKEPEVPSDAKNKAKRWISKCYLGDDGFLRTDKVLEEYSVSEDENDENKKKNSPPKTVEKTTPAKKSPQKKTKANNATAKTKQGSIASFFTRK